MRTATVSKVINGYRIDFYQDGAKACNWYTPDMEEADAWADTWKDQGQLPANVSKPEDVQ